MSWRLYVNTSIFLLAFHCILADERHSENVLSQKHEHLLSNLKEYHLVRPYRSTPDGAFISHDLSTEYEEDRFNFHRVRRQAERRRRRRDTSEFDESDEEEEEQDVFHFSMDAFGTRITLNVTRNTHLVAPSFKVNRYLSDGSVITERPRVNCFYRGNVVGSNTSSVAVSNCRGMSGWIKTREDEYFIEPLETVDSKSATYNFSNGFIHIIYRRRDTTSSSNTETSHTTDLPLGTTDLHDDVMRVGAQRRHHHRASSYAAGAGGRRPRRSAIPTNKRKHYVETMVTLDFSVHNFHGTDEIGLYFLTMMNIVNTVYAHPTLDASVEFVITKANLLSEEMSTQDMVVANESEKSLSNTCRFGRSMRRVVRDDGSDDYFDHSLFITRTHFGPAGYAPVGYMCHISHSCSLVKDEGLQSAFVIAHEAGHVLGLEHDGQGNTCHDDAGGMSIMSTVVIATPKEHYWSECSKNELHENLPSWTCLWDNPFAGTRAINNTRPGRPYSMDDQCRFQFGKQYRKCHHSDVDYCVELYCTAPELDGGCYMKGPPMDGTSCGKQRECVQERCISSKPVDGGWGPWGPWGLCSYSCGLGVQSRRRSCNNPPPDGGEDCEGNSVEHRLCNMQVCPDGPVDKREEECKKQGKIADMTLLAHQNSDPRTTCRLSCVSESTGQIYVSNDYVTDGTPFSYDYPELICIDGKVQSIGCDVEMGSTKFWDNCGVCDGQNATCVQVITDAIDNEPKAKKYKKLLTLTPGMWNLKVTKSAPSSHFLALKIDENGKYILNRGRQQSPTHAFIESGVRFVYTTDGEDETLTAKGPIPFPVHLMAYATGDSRPMNYQIEMYEDFGEEGQQEQDTVPTAGTMDADEEPTATQEYVWEDLGWTECNRECGGGYSFHRFQCTRTRDNKKVKYKLCGQKNYNPKAERVTCNEEPCSTVPVVVTYQWQVSDWSECSATCGGSASRTREVQCFQLINDVQTPADAENCGLASRPHDTEPCGLEACASNWVKGAWSECSATCGPGVRRREVSCGVPEGGLEEDYACQGLEPPSTKKCEMTACPEGACQPMESVLCEPDRFEAFCAMPGYSKICCTTCEEQRSLQSGP